MKKERRDRGRTKRERRIRAGVKGKEGNEGEG
jgi:hypothetical protein